jgi:hypothetical protein
VVAERTRGGATPPENPELTARRRIAFTGGTLALVLFLLVPILTSFTTVFDGRVGSIGAGWVAGAFAVVFPLFGAFAYARWADRTERGWAGEPGEDR